MTCSELSQPFQHLNLVGSDEVSLCDKLRTQGIEAEHGPQQKQTKIFEPESCIISTATTHAADAGNAFSCQAVTDLSRNSLQW